MAARSRRRTLCLRCGLLVLSTLMALGFAEVALRFLGIAFPSPYIPDEWTGSRLQPAWSSWFSKEGRAFVSTNSAGFRDREHPLEKPPDIFRILVLGDSYVEAAQVSLEETFWSVLERKLQPEFARLGKRVEVMAMGVSGWGTAQECQALEHYGFPYRPDLVVLAFLAGNDLRNNSRELEQDPTRPYYLLDGESLRFDESFRSDPQFLKAKSTWTQFKVDLINHSRLLQLIQESRNRWKERAQIRGKGADVGLDDSCFLEPKTSAWKNTWTVTERLLEKMNQDCQQHQARFCVVTISHAIQVHPDKAQREAFRARLGVDDLSYSDRRVAEFGLQQGFPVVALAKPLGEYAESRKEYLHGFANTVLGEGHWNAAGHRVAGEVLAERLKEEIVAQRENTSATTGPAPEGSPVGR